MISPELLAAGQVLFGIVALFSTISFVIFRSKVMRFGKVDIANIPMTRGRRTRLLGEFVNHGSNDYYLGAHYRDWRRIKLIWGASSLMQACAVIAFLVALLSGESLPVVQPSSDFNGQILVEIKEMSEGRTIAREREEIGSVLMITPNGELISLGDQRFLVVGGSSVQGYSSLHLLLALSVIGLLVAIASYTLTVLLKNALAERLAEDEYSMSRVFPNAEA